MFSQKSEELSKYFTSFYQWRVFHAFHFFLNSRDKILSMNVDIAVVRSKYLLFVFWKLLPETLLYFVVFIDLKSIFLFHWFQWFIVWQKYNLGSFKQALELANHLEFYLSKLSLNILGTLTFLKVFEAT